MERTIEDHAFQASTNIEMTNCMGSRSANASGAPSQCSRSQHIIAATL